MSFGEVNEAKKMVMHVIGDSSIVDNVLRMQDRLFRIFDLYIKFRKAGMS